MSSKKFIFIPVSGELKEVKLEDGEGFYEFVCAMLGCGEYEFLVVDDMLGIIVDRDRNFTKNPINFRATALYGCGTIRGDVLVCSYNPVATAILGLERMHLNKVFDYFLDAIYLIRFKLLDYPSLCCKQFLQFCKAEEAVERLKSIKEVDEAVIELVPPFRRYEK